MTMKRVVLTGATGFIGANLARRLLRDGQEVHILAPGWCSLSRIEAIRNDVRLHDSDLGDPLALARIVSDVRPDWIFHLAVHGAYSSQTDFDRMVKTNVIGTINLVEACVKAGFEAFINTGTSSEYGHKDHPPSETEYPEPNSHYAVTKASATLYCRYVAQSRKVHLPTLRLYSAYGPFEEPARLIPALIEQGLQGKLPPLVHPDIAHDFVFIEDVIDAYLLAATIPGQKSGAVYNVGTGIQTTLREAVSIARKAMNITVETEWGSMPDRQWDTRTWVSDSRLIRAELGWSARHTFEHGFLKTLDWARSNRPVKS